MAACAGGAPASAPVADIEASRVYAGATRAAVFERTLAAVQAAGLHVTATDQGRGVITAGRRGFRDDRGWASCPRQLVAPRDDTRRVRLAEPLERDLRLTASIREGPGGPAVGLATAIVERQRNSFTNLTFLERCRSTGALERRILQAV